MKRMLVLFLLIAGLLAGCGSTSNYKIEVTKELYYQENTVMPFEIEVTGKNKPITGLDISVELAMTKMDHDSYTVKLVEGENGTYSGEVQLPMSGKYEAAFTVDKDGKKIEEVIDLTVTEPKGVAKINDEWITSEDLAFYKLINHMQLEINREAAQKKFSGKELEEELSYLDSQEKLIEDKNQLLNQIIRLRSMAMLANEKGHQATSEEIDQALMKARDQYNQFASAKKLIGEYGEDTFWATEKEQYELIVLSQKVQQDVLEKVKKENPQAGEQEIQYLAEQAYEELLISQVNSLSIEIL